MENNNIRILVISDLHAVCSSESNYSFLEYKDDSSWYENTFFQFLRSDEFKGIDLILCAGDIGTGGLEEEFSKGWSFLNKSKGILGVSELFAVPGNHDHKSRPGMSYDPKHHLQFIEPPFPVSCHKTNTSFWAWHWCHIVHDSYNIILVNSSAYHGVNEEYKHGRISEEVVSQISDYLKNSEFPERQLNICLCHHHPLPMSSVDNKVDSEMMAGGDLLVDAIERCEKGPWLFVHGHKHYPKISVRQEDGAESVTIFSAGSFAAKLYEALLDKTSNQFYVLDIDLPKTNHEGRVFGRLNTYEYSVSHGWRPSTSDNLPAFGGFGNIDGARGIANNLKGIINEDNTYLENEDIESICPNIKFLTPKSLVQLTIELEKEGLSVEVDRGMLISVARKI